MNRNSRSGLFMPNKQPMRLVNTDTIYKTTEIKKKTEMKFSLRFYDKSRDVQ